MGLARGRFLGWKHRKTSSHMAITKDQASCIVSIPCPQQDNHTCEYFLDLEHRGLSQAAIWLRCEEGFLIFALRDDVRVAKYCRG